MTTKNKMQYNTAKVIYKTEKQPSARIDLATICRIQFIKQIIFCRSYEIIYEVFLVLLH